MGKLAKPQRSKKHKKIKAVDPFYHGSRKDRLTEGLNQKPKSLEQEVPRKLQFLGYSIDGVRAGKVGKKSVIKFQHHPDGPLKYSSKFSTPLGAEKGSEHRSAKKLKIVSDKKSTEQDAKSKKSVVFKKGKVKVTEETFHNYIDNLGPSKPYKEAVSFVQTPEETDTSFLRRVNRETQFEVTKAKIEEKFDVSDEKKLLMKIKPSKGMSEKKKQRLKEKKEKKLAGVKEKKMEKKTGFAALQDKVSFGDVVHAPPVLSVRPKKAEIMETDRPGLRMPELKAYFDGTKTDDSKKTAGSSSILPHPERKRGKTVKRKSLTVVQKAIADAQRENVIEAYRLLKKKKH
ncbi:hypothetical protein Btru_025077 [Bulinus truncatus]|nr:hypothetical protein Btru_025077 [Bulinus truncatus]